MVSWKEGARQAGPGQCATWLAWRSVQGWDFFQFRALWGQLTFFRALCFLLYADVTFITEGLASNFSW